MSAKVEEFVKEYLKLSGSEAREEGKCLLVRLKGEPGRARAITFSGEEAERRGCELVAVGSPFFRLVAEDARRRGAAFASFPKADPAAALARIPCANCKLELAGAEETRRRALVAHYLFTVSTTKRSQKMVEVAVSDSGEEAPWLYSPGLRPADEEPRELGKEEARLMLERSFQILEEKVGEELRELSLETERLLSEAVDRVQSYYAQLRDEAVNQAEYARSQALNAKGKGEAFPGAGYEEAEKLLAEYDRLEALDVERERSRYQVKAEAALAGALLLSYSSFKCRALLRNLEGSASREVVLSLLPNGELEKPLSCEACKMPVGEIHLCSSGHVVGEECVAKKTPEGELCALCAGQREGPDGIQGKRL
ncbi:MAG: hypothetical protein JTT11_03635 [Candidatus Brockarchaeota archaeon]|nr:hypothetical protein [Candidatus Brockarchaeota archaeon]